MSAGEKMNLAKCKFCGAEVAKVKRNGKLIIAEVVWENEVVLLTINGQPKEHKCQDRLRNLLL